MRMGEREPRPFLGDTYGFRTLAADADHVELNGIDRWVGGVHLHGEATPWRWDEAAETVTGPLPA